MINLLLSLSLADANETAALARRIAAQLGAGDCLLLEGPVGAGKSHFARSLIQSLQEEPEDVPSPTFTLVQTYETPQADIWHCDLYRLTSPDEVLELGLEDALDHAICLIEWPDRLGGGMAKQALTLKFSLTDRPDERLLEFIGDNVRWANVLRAARG